jgi:hypothetical protein
MLETDKFPAAYLTKFASQVNNWLGDMIKSGHIHAPKKRPSKPNMPAGPDAQPAADSYQLGERFVMLFLNDPQVHAVRSLNHDLSELVTPTGRRHYQIKQNGDAVAYARSVIDEGESLCQLFATRLAENVHKAIEKLDEYESSHPEFATKSWRVRLVTVPTFHTHAFLIQRIQTGNEVATSGSYIYVVSAPDWLRKLPRETMLNSRQFLMGFEGERPIIGLRAPSRVQRAKEQMNMQKKKQPKAKNPGLKAAGFGGDAAGANIGLTPVLGNPLFASLIYPFVKDSEDDNGVGGGGGHISTLGGGSGHIGALGGPPEGIDPLFVVFTYPVPPKPKKPDITNT